jgi:RNA polymerase sigma-70 factor, ECF subfamily
MGPVLEVGRVKSQQNGRSDVAAVATPQRNVTHAMSIETVSQATAESESVSLALVERAQTGDARAFEMLMEARFSRLSRLALSITANEADAHDALQEACLRAWRELPRLRDRTRFDAWLWRIVLNSCRSLIRGRRRVQIHEIAVVDDGSFDHPGGSDTGPGEALPERDLIRRAFQRIDADKREILVLHHVEDRPVSDIADILGIPVGTARWRLHAARRALERALEVERR